MNRSKILFICLVLMSGCKQTRQRVTDLEDLKKEIKSGYKQTSQRITDFEDLKKEINKRFPTIEVTDPETYKNDRENEDHKRLTFPMVKASYAILYKNNVLTPAIKLSDKELRNLLSMMNDSANYKWGEIGTPQFDRHIVFYDRKDECVGLAHVSFDGMIYTEPYLKKMKWGMVREPVLDLVKSIGK